VLIRELSMNNPGLALYTPVFSAAGGGAAIGNGTAEGLWRRVGDSIHLWFRITFGATSTYGAGAFQVTLPNSLVRDPAKVLSTSNFVPGGTYLLDASTPGNNVVAFAECAASSNILTFFATRSTGAAVSATVPFAWAASDAINCGVVVPIDGY
jgi:hypothetical protein